MFSSLTKDGTHAPCTGSAASLPHTSRPVLARSPAETGVEEGPGWPHLLSPSVPLPAPPPASSSVCCGCPHDWVLRKSIYLKKGQWFYLWLKTPRGLRDAWCCLPLSLPLCLCLSLSLSLSLCLSLSVSVSLPLISVSCACLSFSILKQAPPSSYHFMYKQ